MQPSPSQVASCRKYVLALTRSENLQHEGFKPGQCQAFVLSRTFTVNKLVSIGHHLLAFALTLFIRRVDTR